MYINKKIGKIGEDISADYLRKNNYTIIEKNFSCKQGEIDIIAKDTKKQELVFIEVKTRTNKKYGMPIEAVDEKKQKHIYKTAEFYTYINKITEMPIRFDVIEIITENGTHYINHIKKAFWKMGSI